MAVISVVSKNCGIWEPELLQTHQGEARNEGRTKSRLLEGAVEAVRRLWGRSWKGCIASGGTWVTKESFSSPGHTGEMQQVRFGPERKKAEMGLGCFSVSPEFLIFFFFRQRLGLRVQSRGHIWRRKTRPSLNRMESRELELYVASPLGRVFSVLASRPWKRTPVMDFC